MSGLRASSFRDAGFGGGIAGGLLGFCSDGVLCLV